VDGGKGTDTLMMKADIAAKFTIGDVVKNFEILKLDGSDGVASVNMNDFGEINHVLWVTLWLEISLSTMWIATAPLNSLPP